MHVPGEDHDAVPRAVHRVAQVGVAAAIPVPILAEMAVGGEPAGLVITGGFRLAHREVEPVRQPDVRRGGGRGGVALPDGEERRGKQSGGGKSAEGPRVGGRIQTHGLPSVMERMTKWQGISARKIWVVSAFVAALACGGRIFPAWIH